MNVCITAERGGGDEESMSGQRDTSGQRDRVGHLSNGCCALEGGEQGERRSMDSKQSELKFWDEFRSTICEVPTPSYN